MNNPLRGEIWRVQFNPTRGDEIQKTRPAVVISADGLQGLRLRLVMPITSWKPSFSLQTRSVSLERFVDQLGIIEPNKLEEIILALALIVQFPVDID